jgi:hypothetical protein
MQQLAPIVQQHLGSMDAISLAAAIYKLSKLQCREQQLYADCLQRYLKMAPTETPRHQSNVMYALCKAPAEITQQYQAMIKQQLLPVFVQKVAAASAQDISNVVYGMAVSGLGVDANTLQQLLAAFVGVRQQAKPQDGANTVWAVATMGQQVPAEQLQLILDAFVGVCQQAKPQDVANTVWAVATMGQQVPAEQLQLILDVFVGMRHQFKPRTWPKLCGQWQPWGSRCQQSSCS